MDETEGEWTLTRRVERGDPVVGAPSLLVPPGQRAVTIGLDDLSQATRALSQHLTEDMAAATWNRLASLVLTERLLGKVQEAAAEPNLPRWRTGRQVGLNVYDVHTDRHLGCFHTDGDAALAVERVNQHLSLVDEVGRLRDVVAAQQALIERLQEVHRDDVDDAASQA